MDGDGNCESELQAGDDRFGPRWKLVGQSERPSDCLENNDADRDAAVELS